MNLYWEQPNAGQAEGTSPQDYGWNIDGSWELFFFLYNLAVTFRHFPAKPIPGVAQNAR